MSPSPCPPSLPYPAFGLRLSMDQATYGKVLRNIEEIRYNKPRYVT
jgi:hypothetical protein